MIFLKVGKIKHKFKLKFTIAKYKYKPEEQIRRNGIFKIKVTRGSHQIQVFSTPSKKGEIKFPKSQHVIPMTLFYDESKNQYLEKQAEVKTYLCDENANVVRTIGKTQLNIAEYAMKERFGLEIQIEGENKNITEDVFITFQMILQRQDDDSKSVNTISEDEQQYKSIQLKQSKDKQKRSKSKDRKNFLFPITQSTVSTKLDQTKIKQSYVSQIEENFSEKTRKYNKQKSPIKDLDEGKSHYKTLDQQQSQNQNFFSRIAQKHLEKEVKKIKGHISKQKRNSAKKSEKDKQQTTSNTYAEDDETKNSSVQFRLFLATKKISELQKQNKHLLAQSTKMKKIVETLIQEKTQRQISQNSTNNQVSAQIQNYKRTIIEKQMRINQLEGVIKLVLGREEQQEKHIRQQKAEIKELRLKLEYEKNKLAKVLQTAMESENMELLEIIQKEINDQFY